MSEADYFICPHCYAEVPYDSPVCLECGSDENTGWSDDTAYDGLQLYNDEPLPQGSGLPPWAKAIAVGLVLVLLITLVLSQLGQLGLYLMLGALLLGGGYYYWRTRQPAGAGEYEAMLYADLRRKARGDEALMARLIDYEAQRNPQGSRIDHLHDAIDRWERDNR